MASHGSSGATGASEPKARTRARVEQGSERKCPTGAVGPVAVDDVTVVEQMLGLDTGNHAQLRETLHIGVIEQLRVLDAAARPGARKCLQHQRIRSIPDRMHSALESCIGRSAHGVR